MENFFAVSTAPHSPLSTIQLAIIINPAESLRRTGCAHDKRRDYLRRYNSSPESSLLTLPALSGVDIDTSMMSVVLLSPPFANVAMVIVYIGPGAAIFELAHEAYYLYDDRIARLYRRVSFSVVKDIVGVCAGEKVGRPVYICRIFGTSSHHAIERDRGSNIMVTGDRDLLR